MYIKLHEYVEAVKKGREHDPEASDDEFAVVCLPTNLFGGTYKVNTKELENGIWYYYICAINWVVPEYLVEEFIECE